MRELLHIPNCTPTYCGERLRVIPNKYLAIGAAIYTLYLLSQQSRYLWHVWMDILPVSYKIRNDETRKETLTGSCDIVMDMLCIPIFTETNWANCNILVIQPAIIHKMNNHFIISQYCTVCFLERQLKQRFNYMTNRRKAF